MFILSNDKDLKYWEFLKICQLAWTRWAYLLVVMAIKAKQGQDAIWGLLPGAITASGNDLCGQYQTKNQTKQNHTLCTDTLKAKEETENRHPLQELQHGTANKKQ